MTDSRTDQELIAAANRGERLAFETLYYRYRNWVMTVAMNLLHNDSDAEEVLQDVFRNLFVRFPGFELTCRLTTFLFPIVRNRSIDLLRKRKPSEALPEKELTARPHADEDRFRRRIHEIVARLPEHQRDVVVLRFVDGLKMSEIAEALEIPTGTVKSRLNHALAQLRKTFDSDGQSRNSGVMMFMLIFA